MSERTRKLKNKVIILTLLSIALLFGPLVYYFAEAAIATFLGGTTTATVANVSIFSTSVIIFGILTIIAAVRKCVFKSSMWVLLIGLYLLLDNILYAVVVIGVCQILDELVVSPLRKHYKQKLVINQEIDKRFPEDKEN